MKSDKHKSAVFMHDIGSVMSARVMRAMGRPISPRLMTFNVTGRCNHRCTICEIHGRKTAAPELSLDEIEKIFSDPVLGRLDVLRITGGEPFLRDDISNIVIAARRLTPCRIIYITTNGSLPRRIEEFASKTLPSRASLHIQISIDALDERHDRIRGVSGALEKALESLRLLAEFRKQHDFHLGINQTIIADNLDQIEPVSRLARETGAGHNIILGAKHHEGKSFGPSAINGKPLPFETQQPMSREQIQEFHRVAETIKRSAHASRVRERSLSAMLRDLSEEYLNQGGRARLLHGRNSPSPACMAAFTHFRLTPAGDVVACSALASHPMGNVRQTTIGEILYSPQADSLRRMVKKCPGCWIECDVNPSIFYSGDIIKWIAARILTDSAFRRAYPLSATILSSSHAPDNKKTAQ